MLVRISALFPITEKDVEQLYQLQKQLDPGTETELWDALDTIIHGIDKELAQIEKGREVYNCVRMAQKSGHLVRTATGYRFD